MGKVLSDFSIIGWPGAISRSVDDIVISMKNAGSTPIPFGAPVFLSSDGEGVLAFDNSASPAQTFATFVGFAVRDASKTPDAYPSGQDMSSVLNQNDNNVGQYGANDVVDIIVRGSVTLKTTVGFLPGGNVYIRKSDGKLVPDAGAEGTTILLENVRMKTPQENYMPCSEVVLINRNTL